MKFKPGKLNGKILSSRRRRRGVAFVYLGLSMVMLLGITGLVVDIGHLHMKEAQAMRAADAAALAGAMQLPDEEKALEAAINYAKANNYAHKSNGTTVTGTADLKNSRYTVNIERPEPLFFIRALPKVGSSRNVGATATAEALSPQDLDADLSIGSGDGVGPINLAVFGPQSRYSYGDAYSTQWLDNDSAIPTPNPRYDPNGYDFRLDIPADYVQKNGTSLVEVQIFDPDGQNLDGNTSPDGVTRIDEMMVSPGFPHPQPVNQYTTTRYRLYKIVDPNDPSKDQLIGEKEYGRSDVSIDMKWVTPENFNINLNDQTPGQYRINVKTLDGSSENGFNLRAIAPGGTGNGGAAGGASANGTSVSAMGRLPINFNQNGLTTLSLGTVPKAARGGVLKINKFDTDVGAQDVYFFSDPPASNQPPGGFPGRLAADGQWQEDQIPLPADYETSNWVAEYNAGLQDTTVWELSYSTPNSKPGGVKLVGSEDKHY